MCGRKEMIIEVDNGVYLLVSKKYSSISISLKEVGEKENVDSVEPTATFECKLRTLLKDCEEDGFQRREEKKSFQGVNTTEDGFQRREEESSFQNRDKENRFQRDTETPPPEDSSANNVDDVSRIFPTIPPLAMSHPTTELPARDSVDAIPPFPEEPFTHPETTQQTHQSNHVNPPDQPGITPSSSPAQSEQGSHRFPKSTLPSKPVQIPFTFPQSKPPSVIPSLPTTAHLYPAQPKNKYTVSSTNKPKDL